MFNIKQAKLKAQQQMKEHYVIFTVMCLVASFIGVSYTYSMTAINYDEYDTIITSPSDLLFGDSIDVINELVFDNYEKGEQASKDISDINQSRDEKVGVVSFGYRRGIFAGLANSVTSGSFFVTIYKTIVQSLRASDLAAKIMVAVAGIIVFIVTVLLKSTYAVIMHRMYLESYIYPELKAPRFLFLFRIGKWFKATLIVFVQRVFQTLWNFTIVGGIIKHFSYSQVQYIVAENPNLTPMQAINLSKRMMDGHKFELFQFYYTYLGWMALNVFTLGFSGMLYSNPYMEAGLLEYYVYVRNLYIENKKEGYELLNDKYLYEFADVKDLIKVYPDLYLNRDASIKLPEIKGIKGFFVKYMGVCLKNDDEINKYNEALKDKEDGEIYKDIFNRENYPARLAPIPEDSKYAKDTTVVVNKVYTLTNLIMMFFIFAFVGWLWEVLLHIVNDGVFVNRGTMHGPWLPIYGGGVCLILLFLYKTRRSLPVHFFSSIVLCGLLEYSGSWFLEVTKGMKWWDYTGYFLNINGRICGEGLLVFGIGGTAAVFLLVPVLDNLLNKIKLKKLTTIVIVLVLCFFADLVYSSIVPNTGEGITDYEDVSLPDDTSYNSNQYIC